MLSAILTLFGVVAFLCLVVGLIKPKLIKQDSRGLVAKKFGLSFVAICVVIGMLTPDQEDNTDKLAINPGDIKNYSVIKEYDLSFNGRKRVRWSITAPEANSLNERVATAVNAAKELQQKGDADLSEIWLEVGAFAEGKGGQLAIAIYTPDGCGNSGEDCNGEKWKIDATDATFTDKQLLVWKSWFDYREQFREDGLLNEKKLKAFLSEKLNLPEEDITIPWITREKIS